jgi:hypothetical protein
MRARAIVRGYLIATEWRGGGCGNEAFATFADKEAADHGLLPAATRILRHGSKVLGKNRSFSSHRSSFRMTRGARMHWYGTDRFRIAPCELSHTDYPPLMITCTGRVSPQGLTSRLRLRIRRQQETVEGNAHGPRNSFKRQP